MDNNLKFNWLLLRGLAREKRHWGDFPERLKQAPYCADVVCLDLPGAGDRRGENAPLSIDLYTERLRAKFLELKSKSQGPWGIISVSMGGMIALNWSSRFKDDFRSVVLINSSAADLSRPFQRLRLRALKELVTLPLKKGEREKTILKLTSNFSNNLTHLAKEWEHYAQEAPMKLSNVLSQFIAAGRFQSPKEIKSPLLVMAARHDHMVNVRCSEEIAQKYQAPLVLHDTAGHDLPLDDPDWIVMQIGLFIQSLVAAKVSSTND